MISFVDTRLGSVVAMTLCAMTGVIGAQDQAEVTARALFESGSRQLLSGRAPEAWSTFDNLVRNFEKSSVADDALLELGLFELVRNRDLDAALGRVEKLKRDYSNRLDTAPLAMVLDGRIALARALTDVQVNAAIAKFDQVVEIFKAGEAIPEAQYRAADAARLIGRADTLRRFTDLETAYPRSPWTALGLFGSARVLTRAGETQTAMQHLQRVRRFAGMPVEAERALAWNSILYRLYIRPAGQALNQIWESEAKVAAELRNVTGLAFGGGGKLGVATRTGVVVLPLGSGPSEFIPARDPAGLFADAAGRFRTLHDDPGAVRNERGELIPLEVTVGGRSKNFKWRAGVETASGELLLAERDLKNIVKLVFDGRTWRLDEYAKGLEADRMAISDVDEVAALDTAARQILVFSRSGQLLGRIPREGEGYRMRDMTDVAFDALGHVYVLDRTTILAFAPRGAAYKHVATFALPIRTEPTMLAVDPSGRLFVFDRRTATVRGFQ